MKSLSKKEFEACLRGEPSAQTKFYELAYPIALFEAKALAKTEVDAEDWAIKAVTHLFNKLYQFTGYEEIDESYWGGRLYKWIKLCSYRMCVGTFVKDKHTRIKRISPEYLESEPSDIFSDSELDYETLIGVVNSHIKGKRELEIFTLCCIDGLDHKDISEQLGISKGTIKGYVCETRAKLRNKLIKLGYERRYDKRNTGRDKGVPTVTGGGCEKYKSSGVSA